jgi:hypothetical protein
VNGRRLGALVLAALLVLGAWFIRRDVIDDDGESAPDDTSVTEPDREDTTELRCIAELLDVCMALQASHPDLDVTIEPAGVTLDDLAALADPADAPLWLTIDPYPAMVDVARQVRSADPVDADVVAVGASQLGIAFPLDDPGYAAALAAHCPDAPMWRCLGDNAGAKWSDLGGATAWGRLRPSFGDVDNSALALASLANALAGYFGDADVTRNRWETDSSFLAWFRRLSNTSQSAALSGGTPLRTMATRPALDAAATATFEVTTIDATGDRFELNYPEPEMWVQAVIATPPGVAAPDDLTADVTALLAADGWGGPGSAGPSLPSASTLLALRAFWNEAT